MDPTIAHDPAPPDLETLFQEVLDRDDSAVTQLLRRRSAPVAGLLLRLIFHKESEAVPQSQVGPATAAALKELRRDPALLGLTEERNCIPDGTAAVFSLLHDQWRLIRRTDANDGSEYLWSMTADGIAVRRWFEPVDDDLATANTLTGNEFIDRLHELDASLHNDTAAQLARIDEQMAALRAERREVQRNGIVRSAEYYDDVCDWLTATIDLWPQEFAAAIEAYKAMGAEAVLDATVDGTTRAGSLIHDYFNERGAAFRAGPHGRTMAMADLFHESDLGQTLRSVRRAVPTAEGLTPAQRERYARLCLRLKATVLDGALAVHKERVAWVEKMWDVTAQQRPPVSAALIKQLDAAALTALDPGVDVPERLLDLRLSHDPAKSVAVVLDESAARRAMAPTEALPETAATAEEPEPNPYASMADMALVARLCSLADPEVVGAFNALGPRDRRLVNYLALEVELSRAGRDPLSCPGPACIVTDHDGRDLAVRPYERRRP